MESVWIVVENESEIVTCAGVIKDEEVELNILVVGGENLAKSASRISNSVKWIDSGSLAAEDFADAIACQLVNEQPSVIIGVANPATRVAFGKTALESGAKIVSNVISAKVEAGVCTVARSVYDEFVEVDTIEGSACLLINPMSVGTETIEASANEIPVETVYAKPDSFIEVLERKKVPASKIEDADYVVGIGYGVRTKEMFEKVKELANVLHAEIGPSMNVAEQTNLMPGSRYIGISGVRIAPKLYIALGLSGAAQHRVGIRDAGAVVVINNDPKAKFFNYADYGIVGDAAEIVPALTRTLR